MTDTRRQPHLLVVNDRQEMIDLLAELLEAEGFQVTGSLVSLDLDRVAALAPDAIIQDLLVGVGAEAGWQFLRHSRGHPKVGTIPIILCTAASVTAPDMAELLERWQVRVVRKPFDIDELLEAVAEALVSRVQPIGPELAP
jgi:CheY-like chemotaxis protein